MRRWWAPWHVHAATGGQTAREQAEQVLTATRARRSEVQAVAERLRQSRQANHFGESIAAAMRGRP